MRTRSLVIARFLGAAFAGAVFSFLFAGQACQAADDGWQSMLHNRNVEARAAFKAALKRNPADAGALRGLALLDEQEDSDSSEMEHWAAFYRVAAASWQAAAWWPEMVATASETGQWELRDAAARDVLAVSGSAPETRASARLLLADAAERAGKTAEAAAIRAKLGFARRWRVIGPFENVSRSGFDKAFAPEKGLPFDRSCTGQDDRNRTWHPLTLVSNQGDCDVAAALRDREASVYYATTAVYSPKDRSVLLHFDPTGASRIWVNGKPVFSDGVYRTSLSFVTDVFRVETRLRQGWNTLLIKIADDQGMQGAFALRFTSKSEEDAAGLQFDPGHAEAQPVDATAPAPPPAEPSLAALIRRQPDSLEKSIVLSMVLRDTGDNQSAIETCRAQIGRTPDFGWVHLELWETLKDDGQGDEARAERDIARRLNPRFVSAEADYVLEDGSRDAADTIKQLKALLRINPRSATVYEDLSETYSNAKMTAEALQAARSAVACTDGPDAIDHLAQTLTDMDRESDASSAIVAGLRNSPNSEMLLSERANHFARENQIGAAIALYQKVIALDPSTPSYRTELADLYRAVNDLPHAAKTLEFVRQQRPQDGSVCTELGDILKEQKRTKEAADLYREAIRLDPSQVEVREKLELITGEEPAIDVAPSTPAQPILAAAKAAQSGGASAIVFLDEARELVYPDYATVMTSHRIIKVFDQAAVSSYGTISLARPDATARVTVEQARILKPDGKIQDVRRSRGGEDNEEQISLPSLAPGDVIDISYRVYDYRQGALSKDFWTEWFFSTPDAPVKLSRFVVITQPGLKFETRAHGVFPEPTTRDARGWRIREWRMTDVPAFKAEALGPGPMDAGLWLDLSTVASWSDIVRWYRDLSGPRCVPDATIRAKAEELTKGRRTEADKISAIVSFVRSIQYQTTPFRMSAYIPTEGKQVLRERYADCKDKAALLTALLKAVGITSEMVLLNLRSQGLASYLPSPRFSHAIAVVCGAAGPMWVDTTADSLAIGDFPFEDQGVQALVIDDATTNLSATPHLPLEMNKTTEDVEATLTEDGKLSASARIAAVGNWAWLLRTMLKPLPEAKRDLVLRGIAAQIVKDASFESGSIDRLDDPDAELVIRSKFHADGYAARAGNFLLVKLPWYVLQGNTESLLGAPSRTQDLELGMARGMAICTVSLRLPQGYRIQDLQPEVKATSKFGYFRTTYRQEGDVLYARFEGSTSTDRVPRAEIKEFLGLQRVMSQESNKQLVLKKP